MHQIGRIGQGMSAVCVGFVWGWRWGGHIDDPTPKDMGIAAWLLLWIERGRM